MHSSGKTSVLMPGVTREMVDALKSLTPSGGSNPEDLIFGKEKMDKESILRTAQPVRWWLRAWCLPLR